MPTVTLDLDYLIRLCLNDPSLRARIEHALAQPPAPIRTPCGHLADGQALHGLVLRTNRELEPETTGFVACDPRGWLAIRLVPLVAAEHDASTIMAESSIER
jgi:hypothetical protein